MSLASIFESAILPIVAIAAGGFVLGRVRDVDPDPLNTVTVYVLVPALVFDSLATTSLDPRTLGSIAAGVLGFTLGMVVVSELVGRALGEREPLLSALVLVAAFSNSGNYGVPLSSFAFGGTGRSTAVVFMTAQGVLLYTLGVYVASRSSNRGLASGLKQVFTIPLVYAVLAALGARWAGVVPPTNGTVMSAIRLVGNAAIPLMLLILGLQLSRTDYRAALTKVGTPTALKTLVAPVVGLGVAVAVGFADQTVARTFVLETATPSAVTPLILLVEFGDGATVGGLSIAEYASTVVFVTTVLSVPVLTLLITALENGLLV
ncbi:AEC family transporter [Haloarculaceae archaeon H-GB1-1]|nr:AEC family transporter [Haloarculaceae archaeon H-GB1-1]